MSIFETYLEALKEGIAVLGKEMLSEAIDQAKEDGEAFLMEAREDLKKWTRQLAKGELSRTEFEALVRAKKALFEMRALTQAGISLTRIQRFRDSLIDLVIDTAFEVIVPF